MWIGQLGRDVELEIIVVRNDSIPKFNDCTARLFERLCKKNKHGNYIIFILMSSFMLTRIQ